jgi:1-acyl-sn-glycerol-3-phosphate acyltransferase
MQQVIIEKPYKFVPPHEGRIWPMIFAWYLHRHLDKTYGIASVERRGYERLRESIAAGHGVLIAANHCRPSDPLLMGDIVRALRQPIYCMASWHLFEQSRVQRFLIRRCGGFSIYREGFDRQSLNLAIDILATARRPLIIFPEGSVTRSNDLLGQLLDGTAFIARAAAKRRAAAGTGRVVIHPVAIKYVFQGDLQAAAGPVLADIEKRLSWQTQEHRPMLERIKNVGQALLVLKEIEYLGQPQTGAVEDRQRAVIERILQPIEEEWGTPPDADSIFARVKFLRSQIVPGLTGNDLTEDERNRRWRQLADLYLAHIMSLYPRKYIETYPSKDRILETVERFEEDLTDTARIHRPLHAIIHVGEALAVEGQRPRGQADPLMDVLAGRMQAMLDELREESGPPLELPPSFSWASDPAPALA